MSCSGLSGCESRIEGRVLQSVIEPTIHLMPYLQSVMISPTIRVLCHRRLLHLVCVMTNFDFRDCNLGSNPCDLDITSRSFRDMEQRHEIYDMNCSNHSIYTNPHIKKHASGQINRSRRPDRQGYRQNSRLLHRASGHETRRLSES